MSERSNLSRSEHQLSLFTLKKTVNDVYLSTEGPESIERFLEGQAIRHRMIWLLPNPLPPPLSRQ